MGRYINKRSVVPYFQVNFDQGPSSPAARQEFHRRYPRLPLPSDATDRHAVKSVYTTESGFKYGPDFTAPVHKPPAPCHLETRADPAHPRSRSFEPPAASMNPPQGLFSNDPDRGLYEWLDLKARPGFGAWKRLQAIPFQTYTGERNCLPPRRLKEHDPTHEKERWDNIRNLIRHGAISYGYDKHMVGYTGHKQAHEHILSHVEKDIYHPNLAMQSSNQATYRAFPAENYMHIQRPAVNKHMEAKSRLVTLANPYNLLSQQSGCCDIMATNAQCDQHS